MSRVIAALFATTVLAALALCVLAGCASGNTSSAAGSRSGVEVFGTIDAGVSHVTNKSGR